MKFLHLSQHTARLLTLSLSVAAILSLFLLAAGLPRLDLGPGQRWVMAEEQPTPTQAGAVIPWDMELIFKIFLIVSGLMVIISLPFVLKSKESRRRFMKSMAIMFIYLAVLALILSLYQPKEQELLAQPTPYAANLDASGPLSGVQNLPPVQEFTPPPTPPWVRYLTSLLVILALGAAGYWLWRITHRPKVELAEITRVALRNLAQGREWEDTVIQCYAQMNAAVSQRRGIERREAMTAREFSLRLEQSGLPRESIQRLTRLFEKARYGGHHSLSNEASEATLCLTDILASLGEKP